MVITSNNIQLKGERENERRVGTERRRGKILCTDKKEN
jgi:hypothetical protein